MSNLLDLAAKEILRKEILQLCYQAAPVGCSMDVLRAAFSHEGTENANDLEIQVDYLQAKNMVSVEKIENRVLNLSKNVVKITADGIDFLEGNANQVKGIGV